MEFQIYRPLNQISHTVTSNTSLLIEEIGAYRQRGVLASNVISLDLVSAYAGDRVLSDAQEVLSYAVYGSLISLHQCAISLGFC